MIVYHDASALVKRYDAVHLATALVWRETLGETVVITTRSADLLDAKWIADRHLRIVEWNEGATRVSPVSDATRKALQGHLSGAGELLRSSALEPAPLFDDQLIVKQPELFEALG